MNRQALMDAAGVSLKDPYSADTITLGIESRQGIVTEEFYLKEMGSPTPKAEVYGNILCVSVRSEAAADGSALIVLRPGGPEDLPGPRPGASLKNRLQKIIETPWLKEAALSGTVLIEALTGERESLDETVSRILRVVSYADLRKDIIHGDRIFLYAEGELGARALIAGVLDERVKGALLLDPPVRIPLSGGGLLNTAEAAGLFQPRRLACLGPPDIEEVFAATAQEYRRDGKASCLRLEPGGGEELGAKLLGEAGRWVMDREEK